MSNRYVWERSTITNGVVDTATIASFQSTSNNDYWTPLFTIPAGELPLNWSAGKLPTPYTNLYVTYGSSFEFANGKFSINGETSRVNTNYLDAGDGEGYALFNLPYRQTGAYEVYFGLSNTSTNSFPRIYHLTLNISRNDGVGLMPGLKYDPASDGQIIFGAYNKTSGFVAAGSGQAEEISATAGTANGTVSNSGASTYPQDGIRGNYWYTYQGQDVIDATAVEYSNQAPMGGQPITINVTPRTPTYGGTIRYTYQVQLDNGEWTTIETNVTATSQQYTIPAGTNSFAARVLASDTWGFSSSDYTTGTTLTVTNNLPPSAPDGITIGDVLGGQQCTITWGAATDSDGTIDHYELERQVDNGDTWTQIFSGNALTYSDTINSEWATVNYRVRAVDDDGEAGPYTTGTMQTVNAGWLYFSGPAADMGDKPAPFDFVFSIGSTTPDVTDISVEVLLDDEIVYTGTPDAAEQVSVHIDTRLMFAGEHVLVITAEKQNLLGLDQECTFTVPAVTLPDGGRMVQLYNDEGQAVFPLTLGRAVIGKGGEDINEILDRVFSGTYTGTGTSGSGNPCQLRLSFVPRFMFVYSNGATPASGWWIRTAEPTVEAQGTMETTGGTATVTWDNDNMTLSWYAVSAAVQLNASGTAYGYMIIG